MSREDSPFVRPVAEDEGYNWTHRAFLQAFQTHGVMTVDVMKGVFAAILTAHDPQRLWTAADITAPQLTNALQTINARLEPFEFEIRNTRDQRSKTTLYALVNNTSDALTQLATTFSAAEIAFIRRLLDAMFDAKNTPTREVMALKHAEASQLSRPPRRSLHSAHRDSQTHGGTAKDPHDGPASSTDLGISIAEADAVLDTLVHDAFLHKSRAGYFSLAPRALMELRAYLKETYNDDEQEPEDAADQPARARIRIRDCEGCRELVTHGIRCNRRDCGVRWHDACANSYYRGKAREARKCPRCGVLCEGDVYVGERADQGGRQSGASTGGSGRRRTAQSRGEEEEEEEE